VDLGLASISRSLENRPNQEPYAVVFVARSGQPSAFHSQFPQMVAVASTSREPIRLVGFSKSCEERLSSCLGIPRVSSIGLRDGVPQAKALLEFVRQHVPPVEMTWLPEAKAGQYLETKINALEVPVGTKKSRTA
jgi:ribonuclease P/MRP protein subunit POP3